MMTYSTKVLFLFYFLNMLLGMIFIFTGSYSAILSFTVSAWVAYVLGYSRDYWYGGK